MRATPAVMPAESVGETADMAVLAARSTDGSRGRRQDSELLQYRF